MTLRQRNAKPFLLITLAFFGCLQSVSQFSFATEWVTPYFSGRESCARHGEITHLEMGRFIDVPVSYRDPRRGVTSLYFWTTAPLDHSKPTVLYLMGGPGGSAHGDEFAPLSEHLNFVYVDQRGIGCSKASTVALHRNPSFYSSENIAHDLEQVRIALGVDQVTLYGHSYGTVPATIYASIYPQKTRALILEGTVSQGGRDLYQSEYVRNLVQRHFDRLRPELQEKILLLSRDPRLSPAWYSKLNQFMMYLDDSFQLLDQYLEAALSGDRDASVNALSGISSRSMVPSREDEFGFSLVAFGMLGCQELGLDGGEAAFFSVFDQSRHLISDQDSSAQNRLCHELGASRRELFSAEKYPVLAPVTYFQGEYDGATALPGAIQHFEKVPKGKAQFLTLERGGHLPNQNYLKDRGQNGAEFQQKVFVRAVRGERISNHLLQEWNRSSSLKWRYQARHGW
jgi:proline iminopeptidase